MFDFFETMRQESLFGKSFTYRGQELLLVFATGLKKPKQADADPDLEWVFAVRATDEIPALTFFVPCNVSELLKTKEKDR